MANTPPGRLKRDRPHALQHWPNGCELNVKFMLLCAKWFRIPHGDALSMHAMSLPRGCCRNFACGRGYEAVSHGKPWPIRPAAPAGARIDTCWTVTVEKSPTGPRTSHSPRTGSASKGWGLSARPVPLRKCISGTPRPTGVTRDSEPCYTVYQYGALHGIASDKAHIAVSSAGVFKSAAGNSSIPIEKPA